MQQPAQAGLRALRAAATTLVFSLSFPASNVHAQQAFAPFGARSISLGGATIALHDEPASALDNPATAATTTGSAASLGGVVVEAGDFVEPLRALRGTNLNALAGGSNPGALAAVRANLVKLSQPSTGLLGDGRLGVMYARSGWIYSATTTVWSGVVGRPDLVRTQTGDAPATSIRFNDSRAAFRALTVQDIAIGRGMSLVMGRVAVGATVHVLRGTTSSKEESVFTTESDSIVSLARRGTTGVERTRTRFAYDVGALVALGPVRFGGTYRIVNGSEFPFDAETAPLADRGRGARFGSQGRIGASVKLPGLGLLVAADLDLTKNETMVPGLKSRTVGGGVELSFGPLVARGGLNVNLESPGKEKVLSAGVGVSVGLVKADAAAVYRPGDSAVGAILSVGLKI